MSFCVRFAFRRRFVCGRVDFPNCKHNYNVVECNGKEYSKHSEYGVGVMLKYFNINIKNFRFFVVKISEKLV